MFLKGQEGWVDLTFIFSGLGGFLNRYTLLKATMKQNNQRRNPMGSPPLPNALKKYKSEVSLGKQTLRAKIAEEYCLKQSKPEVRNFSKPMISKCENEENLLPLNSELKQAELCSDSNSPTFESELERKRVTFGEDKYCFARNNKRRQPQQEPQRKSSLLKIHSQISRSNSIVSLKTSIEKNLCWKETLPGTEPTLLKYKNLLANFEGLKKESKQIIYRGEKYTDTLFPPVLNSLFISKQVREQQRISRQIVWKRISEVFKGKRLRLRKEVGEESSIRVKTGKYCSPYFSESLQAVKNVDDFLTWIFGQTTFNVFGIYCLRIYQNNVAKYILIDDFIPVIADPQNEWVPAFAEVENVGEDKNGKKGFQIWPFLLQKAYASYYSCYESLKVGNLLDFLEQITGNTFSPCFLSDLKKNQINSHVVIRKSTVHNKYQQFFSSSKRNQTKEEPHLKVMKYSCPNQIISKVVPPKEGKKEGRPSIFLKKIVVKGNIGQSSLVIRQKDEKFYNHNLGSYEYIWVRAIVLMAEYDGSYHWMEGQYAQSKSINFNLTLSEGSYYLLIMPQWKHNQRGQISVILNSQSKEKPVSEYASISCLPYDEKQKMLEKGCGDLAQRVGQLKQLNKVTCSYNYVCTKSGLVIQSVYNERLSGEIAIERLWKSTSHVLYPFNEDFKGGQVRRVEVVIPKEGFHTWIYGCVGGLHQQELSTFDFK